jgi:hypothetical protein
MIEIFLIHKEIKEEFQLKKEWMLKALMQQCKLLCKKS